MTSVSKNAYIDKLDDIVNRYNKTCHITIKVKPVDVNQTHILTQLKKLITKILNFKSVILLGFQNLKTFLQGYTPYWSEEVFVIKKVKKVLCHVVNDLNGEEIVGTFYKNELQKTNQKEFRIKKVIKRKGDKLCVKWKGYDIV